MVPLTALWLPIVLSAVIVFVASSLLHMLLTYHQSDCKKIADEDKVLAALRTAGLQPGIYIFPYFKPKDMKSPAVAEKLNQGPVGMITVRPNGVPAMPKFLGLWFGYCLVVGIFVACLAGSALPAGTNYLLVFRVVGTAGFLAYGLGSVVNAIWKSQPWGMTIKEVIDGLVYGLLTAGTFGWLWPR
jgi:hypothetical protein